MSDNFFDVKVWWFVDGFDDLIDIIYYCYVDDVMVWVVFNCFEVCNVFCLYIVDELYWVFDYV